MQQNVWKKTRVEGKNERVKEQEGDRAEGLGEEMGGKKGLEVKAD